MTRNSLLISAFAAGRSGGLENHKMVKVRTVSTANTQLHLKDNLEDLPFIITRKGLPVAVVIAPSEARGKDEQDVTEMLDKVIAKGMVNLTAHPEKVTLPILMKALERRNQMEKRDEIIKALTEAEEEMFGGYTPKKE